MSVSISNHPPSSPGTPGGSPTPDQLRQAVSTGVRAALWTVLVSTILALVKITAGVLGKGELTERRAVRQSQLVGVDSLAG